MYLLMLNIMLLQKNWVHFSASTYAVAVLRISAGDLEGAGWISSLVLCTCKQTAGMTLRGRVEAHAKAAFTGNHAQERTWRRSIDGLRRSTSL